MLRITSLAAAAAILGYTGLALAQQPAYSPSYGNRYATQPTTGTTMPAERQSWSPWRQTTTSRDTMTRDTTMARDTTMPTRQRTMNAGQFSSESDARAHCAGDTVVWVNTKSHVYHFAGSKDFGNTKHGGFMCRADADRAGTFHAAKNELRMQGTTNRTSIERSMTSRFSGSSTSRY